MQILLPPSAGKTTPAGGPTLSLDTLSFPELTKLRRELVGELREVSAREDALEVLGVGARVADDVAAQICLNELACAPAIEVNTGVLYAGLDAASLSETERERANRHVIIFSGLFGMLRPSDFIPAYRLSMGTFLPGGNNTTRWKKAMTRVRAGEGELIVDCRSGAYQVWNPPGSQMVTIRAERLANGTRQVVSHNAKHYRGLLAGLLLRANVLPEDLGELVACAHTMIESGHIHDVELHEYNGRFELTLVEHA